MMIYRAIKESQSERLPTDEAFQEQRFLLERGAPVVAVLVLLNFQDTLYAQEPT